VIFLLSHVISTTVLHHKCKIHSGFIIDFIVIRICCYLTLIIYLYANIVPITCNNTFVVISGYLVVDNGICCSFWLTCENSSVNFYDLIISICLWLCVVFDTETVKSTYLSAISKPERQFGRSWRGDVSTSQFTCLHSRATQRLHQDISRKSSRTAMLKPPCRIHLVLKNLSE
jgi:hypothetical protein